MNNSAYIGEVTRICDGRHISNVAFLRGFEGGRRVTIHCDLGDRGHILSIHAQCTLGGRKILKVLFIFAMEGAYADSTNQDGHFF